MAFAVYYQLKVFSKMIYVYTQKINLSQNIKPYDDKKEEVMI